jgi:hypothetical protein
MQSPNDAKLIELLLSRLERISVDSYWAHRASGLRGALLRVVDQAGMSLDPDPHVEELITASFDILKQVAKEARFPGGKSDWASR